MADAAIIFDVDGVLLEMTRAEEDTFFAPFIRRYGLTSLSRDWNSYAIRNDEEIVAEIFARHDLPRHEQSAVISEYLALLNNVRNPVEVPGTRALLAGLQPHALGIATANFREAARLRLDHLGLWRAVEAYAYGAEGGGHKSAILARAIASTGLPKQRIIYIGDNLNDVRAGLENGVHFIGFSQESGRLETLAAAGAGHVSANHQTTAKIIRDLLRVL